MTLRILAATAAVVLAVSASAANAMFAGEGDGLPASGEYVAYGNKWGPSSTMGTTGGAVTYSFMATGTSCEVEFAGCTTTALDDFFPSGWQAEIIAAFDAWATVADIAFMEVPDSGDAFNAPGASGDIRIGGHAFDGAGNTLAHGFFPPPNGDSAAGDIHFDTAEPWNIGAEPGKFDIFLVAAHEIGHAIGLQHEPATDSLALMNPIYNAELTGLQADDIAGAQAIYGPNAAVPLPATLPLAAAGVGLLGWAGGRRRVVARG